MVNIAICEINIFIFTVHQSFVFKLIVLVVDGLIYFHFVHCIFIWRGLILTQCPAIWVHIGEIPMPFNFSALIWFWCLQRCLSIFIPVAGS